MLGSHYDLLDKWRTETNAPVPTELNQEFDQQILNKEQQKRVNNRKNKN